jgi:IrrE N-terminal-like domain
VIADDPRVEALAAQVRRPKPSSPRLDIEATAAAAEVEIRWADLGVNLLATVFGDVVVLNSHDQVTPGRRCFGFAHELGHVLIRRGHMPWVGPWDEEWWADWFAHELIFPRSWLRDPQRFSQLLLFDDPAEHRTLALQLATLRSRKAVLFVDNQVVCAACGENAFFPACECRYYRDRTSAWTSLPRFVPPSSVCLGQLQLFQTEDVATALWTVLVPGFA